ncbi:hypothetical protein, partial [Streptomyces sp. 900105755]
TVLWPMPTDNDPASWALRAETWQHEDVMLGGSGALRRLCARSAGAGVASHACQFPLRFN